jgi:N6-L-threonylcarbamoyladenine synthase
MIILAIETSCDETAVAIVKNGTKVLSSVVASSQEFHIETGGIIPEVAARQQLASIIAVIEKSINVAFSNSKSEYRYPKQIRNSSDQNSKPNTDIRRPMSDFIDAIAVTYGPGLIGSLLVGVETAKTLSYLWDKPIVPVNHLVGHIYANFIRELPISKKQAPLISNYQFPKNPPKFPSLAIVVSGGHTDLVIMNSHGDLEWLGGTRDDAAGEAFDKSARLLGLPYPGGPAISASAEKLKTKKNLKLNLFPRPMINSKNLDFSFSGLKTAVFNRIKEQESGGVKDKTSNQQLAAEVQEAIVDVLVAKLIKAINKYKPKSFLLSGGVAANSRLREKLKLQIANCKLKIDLHVPPPSLCTDNAAYIASAAYFNYKPVDWRKIKADPQLRIVDVNKS